MPLIPATRLGPYEILAPLGAGGMGEVYRARDTRLGREVAIKVLPQHLRDDPELRGRFEREARTISGLSHPSICTLFDVGRDGDTDYLVMELIEGETLEGRLTHGPIAGADVIRIGAQIADALARAHRAGIVHRDLKPGNVMLTRSGVKLMDFGLARATGLGAARSATFAGTQSPTAAAPLTAEGTIVGTFHYMAPEQLEGREADARSDIWALGCVLYEMVTGRRAFEGVTQASLISAIMRDTPRPLAELQPLSPAAFQRIVTECLAKDPDERWQSAQDLARELRRIEHDPGSATPAANPASRQWRAAERLTWIGMAVLLGAGVLFLATRKPPAGQRVISSILAPAGQGFDTRAHTFAVSPDGRRIAIVCADSNGTSSLWVRAFDQVAAQPLSGTEGAQSPFWSPDGQDLGFFADGQLKRISLGGGVPQVLARATMPSGGSWSVTGDIIYADTRPSRLVRVSKDGGPVSTVLDSATTAKFQYSTWPTMLPDGNHFLFTTEASWVIPGGMDGIYVAALRGGGAPVLLVPDARNPIYRSSGHLLYWRSGILWSQRFDPSRQTVNGTPERIAENVAFNLQLACAQFSAGAQGPIAYLNENNAELSELCWIDRTGRDLGTVTRPGQYYWPRISHAGTQVAVDVSIGVTNQGDIWTFEFSRGLGERITSDPLNETSPMWAIDDSRLYWASTVEAPKGKGIHSRALRSRGGEETVLASEAPVRPFDVTPDGRTLIFGQRQAGRAGRPDILQLSLANGTTTPIVDSDAAEGAARLSRDGHWLAYLSDETGRYEVYVQRFPEGGEKWRISTAGGESPVWRGDGRELFYVEPPGQLMAVSFRTSPTVEVGSPVPLFRKNFGLDSGASCFDVTPDGQRFLIIKLLRSGTASSLVLDQGWSPQRP